MARRKKNEEVKELQFPSLEGANDVEVAKRSQDVEEEATDTHEKVFVLLKADYESADKDALHFANLTAARQYLMNQGLRPSEDGEFTGESDNGKRSVNLTYRIKVSPAAVASRDENDSTARPSK